MPAAPQRTPAGPGDAERRLRRNALTHADPYDTGNSAVAQTTPCLTMTFGRGSPSASHSAK